MSKDPDIKETALRLLAAVRPFNSLPQGTRLRLAEHASERCVIPGEMIVREGEAGNEFYLVSDGTFHVLGRAFDGTDLVLARLEAGSCFGNKLSWPRTPARGRPASARSRVAVCSSSLASR